MCEVHRTRRPLFRRPGETEEPGGGGSSKAGREGAGQNEARQLYDGVRQIAELGLRPAIEELGQAERALTPGISLSIPPRWLGCMYSAKIHEQEAQGELATLPEEEEDLYLVQMQPILYYRALFVFDSDGCDRTALPLSMTVTTKQIPINDLSTLSSFSPPWLRVARTSVSGIWWHEVPCALDVMRAARSGSQSYKLQADAGSCMTCGTRVQVTSERAVSTRVA
ncbi:hypothetical protein C8R45DRAFT_925456 [Mycena sanguinolenta]|nr:hypothetical protein C8R45DRAFT_925456 [Mycena sanguinolenta]